MKLERYNDKKGGLVLHGESRLKDFETARDSYMISAKYCTVFIGAPILRSAHVSSK